MKRQLLVVAATLLALGVLAVPADSRAGIALFEYAFNIDGTVSNPPGGDPVPPEVNLSGFDTDTGLGQITAKIRNTGSGTVDSFFDVFFDIDIDENLNTFFNEYGAAHGTPAPGQSWEIDEPGYVFGDIYDNFAAGTLDNSNGVPQGSEDDVSMALGWDFALQPHYSAQIRVSVSDVAPVGVDFYLQQTDPDSPADIYLWGELAVRPDQVVPEPASMLIWTLLPGFGLAARWWRRKPTG